MPFDPRTKARKTTTLPAALRDELGLPPTSAAKRPYRPQDRRNRFSSQHGAGRPQLKAIGRPQSAVNGAAKGTPRAPIKSLRNQEKEQQQQQTNPRAVHKNATINARANAAASSSASSSRHSRENETDTKATQKRRLEEQPDKPLKVIKKSKSSSQSQPRPAEQAATEHKTRVNPFTGEVQAVKPTNKKASSTKRTALEKMLARAEAGPSSASNRNPSASDGLAGGNKKSRRHMSQQEKEEEDEIRWLEYNLGKSRSGEDVVRDDLDDFLDDLDRFQVGMYDESDQDTDEDEEDEESDDSGLQDVSASESEEAEGASEAESASASEDVEQDQDDGLDDEARYDFDSNDEEDFSNWDAAMATTDEEALEDQDDDETSTEEDVSDDESEEVDSEAEEARALIEASSSIRSPSETAAASAPASASTATTKYVPPALRAKLAAESAGSTTSTSTSKVSAGPGVGEVEMDPVAAQKLRRQTQGLLNRLGDGNIDTILTEYETLYRTHARAHVTATITQLILDTVTSRSNLVDTFVILHAALVAALHKVVGVEFAAYFIQRLVEELTKHYDMLKSSEPEKVGEEKEEEGRGKECLNLTVLACELYNLHVVACPLIYDLIRMFLGQQPGSATTSDSDAAVDASITEVDIELLLKTIRSCGHQLRQDDATSLKSIIALTQSRVSSSASSSPLSTRTKFMLERMVDLQKTAKSGKGGAAANDASNPNSPSGQLLTRMKKYLGGLAKKRTVKSYEALRIGLKDLRDAGKKGKWWLVGAAWTGQTDQGDAQGLTKLGPMNARASAIQSSSSSTVQVEQDTQQQQLLELARAQGMNTDARRIVFITLLSAEDYKQAAENVLMLKLNDVQRREVVRVLVHCVGSEAIYNPYYTLIGHEICRNDHGMRITLQYCLWDFLREIGQKQVGGEKFAAALFSNVDDLETKALADRVDPRRIANLARAYAWWLTHDCLSLQALKTVDFTALHARPAQFVGLLVIYLVLSIQSAKSPAKTLHLPTVTRPLQTAQLTKFLHSNLVAGSTDLARGLLLFLNTQLDPRAQKSLILGQHRDYQLKNKLQPLLQTVQHGLSVMVNTVQTIVQQLDGVQLPADQQDIHSHPDSDVEIQDDY